MFQTQTTITGLNAQGITGKDPLFGKCDGRFALTILDAQFLQSLLPPDLELAPQPYAPEGSHPLLLMFNDTWLQSNDELERITKEYHIGLNLHYNEFIVMLPYVQFKDKNYNEDAPYCFLPVLYLDSLLAVLGGRVFWEFNKELARFITVGTEFNVLHELTGNPLFYSTFNVTGRPVPGSSVSNFNAITPILQLPVLEYGIYGYVSSVYTVGFENQLITASSLSLINQSCQYLPLKTLTIPGIDQNPMGCFYMSYNWSLSFIKFIKL
jgi:hypothetical protein